MAKQERPNTEKILAGLKDFQRNTVDYVFRRMYLDEDRVHRFLVADEVGLGKTLVARGLIAKAIDHLWNRERRIDIVYVCSNAEIARQNIGRLNVLDSQRCNFATRLTLLAITLKELQKEKINFISFTPTTSFDMNSTGWSLERELLYILLFNRLESGNFKKMTRVLAASAGLEQFRKRVEAFGDKHTSPHPKIELNFQRRLDDNQEVVDKFLALCEQMPRDGVAIPADINRECNRTIGELRRLLAEAGLEWLEPDLVILDEFQRFKELLGGELEEASPAAELAHKLFTFREDKSDADTETRVLLLSATPYKMYTTHQEKEVDDHYSDFQSTLQFLMPVKEQIESVVASIQTYRENIWNLGNDNGEGAIAAKNSLESQLRKVMARTERLASSADRSGMLVESHRMKPVLAASDIQHFMALEKLTREVQSSDLLSFWKSSPYLLNFMDDYDFKRQVQSKIDEGSQDIEFVKAFNAAQTTLIAKEDVEQYARIDPANAQLRGLEQEVIGKEHWRLLWIPPSLPYYQPGGAFANSSVKDVTKTLVFSSWKVVPKVVASLLSYEAERSMFHSFNRKSLNTGEARAKRSRLLQFDVGKSGAKGMPVFALIYPCSFLARRFDPSCHGHAADVEVADLPRASEVMETISASIEKVLRPHLEEASQKQGDIDRRWYWASLLLLDQNHDEESLKRWLNQPELDEKLGLGSESESKGWQAHLKLAKDFVEGRMELGRPPKNLCRILAAMAVGGPGICALRGLNRTELTAASPRNDRHNASMRIAEGFIHLFNLPEVIAMLRGQKMERVARAKGKAIPYWETVLRYCVNGNLQAVLDEYLHILTDSPGASMKSIDGGIEKRDPCETVSSEVYQAMAFRTSSIKADTFRVTRRSVSLAEPIRFRTRFAMAFGDQRNEDDSEGSRKEHVRDAFNSPFWPFVLVSTSVGQEGLDFHRYCHSILHWNLPSNPVDLEQREGRIHRYKSHALRRNIAWKFGKYDRRPFAQRPGHDHWKSIFDAAYVAREAGKNDLHPFWISDEGPAKIERHVSMLPLSREKQFHADLMRSLTVYRLVFGQNRQEDMLQYLLNSVDQSLLERVLVSCHINLSPARSLA